MPYLPFAYEGRLAACGIANTCYVQILVDTADKTCEDGVVPDGCIIHYDLTSNNILTQVQESFISP